MNFLAPCYSVGGMNDSSVKEELKIVLDLLKLKNEKAEDLARDKTFLSSAFAFLENNSECIWCQYPQICGDLLRIFSFDECPPLIWYREKTIYCLTSCRACIESYYGIRPKLFSSFRKIYDEETVKDFEGKIHQFDVKRLQDPFINYLQNDNKENRKKIPIKFILFEILLFPGWIVSKEISNLFEKVLDQIISSMKMVKISEKLPGVIVCSVHPNQVIRNWAKSVLNSDSIQSTNPESNYLRINYSWDTVTVLSRQLEDDSVYSDAIYICLKSSQLDFIKSCTNWDWTGRIFQLLKKENNTGFMESLRLYNLLLKTLKSGNDGGLSMNTSANAIEVFPWYKIPDSFTTITSILDNPAFSNGPHTDQDCANFVLDWIPVAIEANLSEKKFKIAHKIVADLMDFIIESRAPFQWKVKVAQKFSYNLADSINNPYLLGKICQLLLFLFDKRFSEFRTSDQCAMITKCSEKVLISLIRSDFITEFGIEMEKMEGSPSSAVFDASNYRKFLFSLESREISLNFLNSIGKELSPFILKEDFSIESKIWHSKIDLLTFVMKSSNESVSDILNFSYELILCLIFINLSGIKLQTTSPSDEFFKKLIKNHPEKCLKSITKIISIFVTVKYKMKEGIVIPLEKTFYFLNNLIGSIFEKDLEILKIYPERFDLIFKYFIRVLFQFFTEFNNFISLPGGSVYYEFSTAISSFGITLIGLIGTESFQKSFKKYLTPNQISNLLLPSLSSLLMNIIQRSNQSKYTDIPSLVNLSTEFIILSGHLRADFEVSRVDQIAKVLLTSNVLPAYKASISSSLQQYCKLSGKKFVIPSEPVKTLSGITGTNNPNRLDLGIVKKLEALERMEDEFIHKQISTSNSSNLKQSSSSRLGQLRQEMAKDGTPTLNASTAKKSRFTPVIVTKAPRLMTQADLLRARAESSDSGEDVEITSETFKNAPKPNPHHQQPHRSVKLIDIEDESNSNGIISSGKPISSKATISAQMQRDWQSAQRLHKYILSLDYSGLNDTNLLTDLSIQCIPDTFPSYEKYLQVFEPLLQLECRSQIIQAKDEAEGRLAYFKGTIQTVSIVDDFHEVVFNFGDDAVHRLFTEQDLLVGHPVAHGNNSANKEILGLVIQTSSRQNGFEVTIRFYMKIRTNDVEFQLLTRLKQAWKFAKLCNMVTNNREFLALQNLPLYSSCARVLQPKFLKIDSILRGKIDKAAEFYTQAFGLNLPQALAISYALLNPNLFTLIQGPPGTGKTRTIEGFLAVLFGRPSTMASYSANSYKRVMICAPSNAAIDEIVRRLKGGITDSYRKRIPLKIVRVGSIEMIHEDVKDLSVDGIVESMIQGHIASALEMLQTNRKQMNEIKALLDKFQSGDISGDDEDGIELTDLTNSKQSSSKSKNVQELKNQLWQVKENIRKGNKFIEDSRQNLRLKVLNEAQVVCCTLSASGHEVISRIEGDFEMVIIDEACQAIELSSLIPLQYGCKRAILVGDPNQLPPTVISQMAATFSYEQSLFQRLQKIDPSAVQLLSLQYRMHPQISSFPSSYFYGGRLADGPNVLSENTRPWHKAYNGILGPCRFFDIPGQEQLRTFSSGRQGNSMMNELEAKITASLIALLYNSDPSYQVKI